MNKLFIFNKLSVFALAAHGLFAFSIVYLFVLFATLLIDHDGKASTVVAMWASTIASAVGI